MGGGKSSSSSAQTSNTTSTSGTATGTVGDVYQGQTVTITEEFPDAAVEVFKQLIDLASNAQAGAKELVSSSLDKATTVIGNAATPDANIVEGTQQTITKIAFAAAAAIVAFKVFGSK